MIRILFSLLVCACSSSGAPEKSTEELFEHYRIAASPGSLSIPQEAISNDTLTALLADPRMPALTSIELSNNAISTAGLTQILESPKTAGLRFLNLAHNRLDDASVALLAQSPRLASVEHLLLAGNQLSAEGIRHLSESPHLGELRILSLGGQGLGSDAAAYLANLGPLHTLDLSDSAITASGASLLFTRSQAESLLLRNNPLHRDSFSVDQFSNLLRHLDLRGCKLGAPQLVQLTNTGSGERLETMNLSQNPLGDDGLDALGKVAWLNALEKLEAFESDSTLEARKRLRESWGRRGGLKVETR